MFHAHISGTQSFGGDCTAIVPKQAMCLHIIPGIWMDDWGVEINESIRVTPQGGQPLVGFER